MDNATDFNGQVFSLIKGRLKDLNKIPYLFAGSGLSLRYMQSENWKELLKWVCDTIGPPMKKYVIYEQLAMVEGGSPFPKIATLMEDDFLKKVLPSPAFSTWVEQHETELDAHIPALKLYIAEHLKTFKPTSLLDELEELRKASREIAGVITTNYDTLLESVFEDYDCYISQAELLFASTTGIGEIYKMHGSVTNPETMLLTAQDFADYHDKQDYMLSKILTIFGEYPIIFIGYSLNDQNIREVIGALAKYAGAGRAQEFAKRFVFIDYSPTTHDISKHSFTVGDGAIVEMTYICTDDFTPIYSAIAQNRQRLAPRVISQFSRELYRIGTSGKPVDTIKVAALEDLDRLPQDMQILVGLGKMEYGETITAKDLYQDVIIGDKHLPANLVVESYLEKLLVQNSGGLPMFGYLLEYGKPITTPRLSAELIKRTKLSSYCNRQEVKSKANKRRDIAPNGFSVNGLIATFGEDNAYKYVPALEESEIDVEELKQYLVKVVRKSLANDENFMTPLRKAINIYDFLKNEKHFRSL